MAAMKIYLAAPFFDDFELDCVRQAEDILFARGFDVFSPRLHEVRTSVDDLARWSHDTFRSDRDAIDGADAMVMLYHGAYSDSGTAWEAGYACGKGKPVVAVHLGSSDAGSNLMIHESAAANITLDELPGYDFKTFPPKPYEGRMY